MITHQKRTMEVADALYGVTMRGDGVTTVIGQRLRDGKVAPEGDEPVALTSDSEPVVRLTQTVLHHRLPERDCSILRRGWEDVRPVDAVWLYLIFSLAVLVLVVVAGVMFVRGRGRRLSLPPEATATEHPPEAAPTGEEPVAVLEAERPAPTAGRLTRLRGRLARSSSALGQGLLDAAVP